MLFGKQIKSDFMVLCDISKACDTVQPKGLSDYIATVCNLKLFALLNKTLPFRTIDNC